MSEIAFIGDRNTVWPFKAFGVDLFFADEQESMSHIFSEIAQRQFTIVFVTEEIYEEMRERIDALAEESTPTFTVIPSQKGNRGTALQMIRDSVRRAMGAEFI